MYTTYNTYKNIYYIHNLTVYTKAKLTNLEKILVMMNKSLIHNMSIY